MLSQYKTERNDIMRYVLDRSERSCFIPIYESTLVQHESTELVIPDIREDVDVIVDVRGQLTLQAKKVMTDSAVISASVYATAIYRTENGEKLECVSVTIPFEFNISEPGIDEETELIVSLDLCCIEAKPLNPRKLMFKAQVSAKVRCLIPDNFSICTGIPEAAEKACIHTHLSQVEHSLISGVREKTFTVSDEYQLPKGIDESATLICTESSICVNEVKTVGSKLVFKATTDTVGYFMTSDGLKTGVFSSVFSQIIETDAEHENANAVVLLELMSADFTRMPDSTQADYAASFRICAAAICTDRTTNSYISDAYSNCRNLELDTANITIRDTMPAKTLEVALEGALPTGMSTENIVYLSVSSCCAVMDNCGRMRVTAQATGVCKSDEGCMPVCVELSGGDEIVLGDRQCMSLLSLCCNNAVTFRDNSVCSGAKLLVEVTRSCEIRAICAIEYDEDKCLDNSQRPSLIVLCSKCADADLWTIAKKYGSSIEAIEKANSISGEFYPHMRPLLVPKTQ
jgi:hypothetical protein